MGRHDSAVLKDDFLEAVIQATSFFGVPLDISLIRDDMPLAEIPGWDSLNQITFALSLTRSYGLRAGVLQVRPEETLADVRQKISLLQKRNMAE